jgi:hypothetical protein
LYSVRGEEGPHEEEKLESGWVGGGERASERDTSEEKKLVRRGDADRRKI